MNKSRYSVCFTDSYKKEHKHQLTQPSHYLKLSRQKLKTNYRCDGRLPNSDHSR